MFLRKLFFITILSLFSLSVFGYGIYKALPIILGPKVELSYPQNAEVVEGTTIPVRGTVTRVKTLYINSIPTAFTESGSFETRLSIYPGNNILVVEGYDRFGRLTTITRNIGTK
jgi:hypothetical protein